MAREAFPKNTGRVNVCKKRKSKIPRIVKRIHRER
jgi:hypothetical protein